MAVLGNQNASLHLLCLLAYYLGQYVGAAICMGASISKNGPGPWLPQLKLKQ